MRIWAVSVENACKHFTLISKLFLWNPSMGCQIRNSWLVSGSPVGYPCPLVSISLLKHPVGHRKGRPSRAEFLLMITISLGWPECSKTKVVLSFSAQCWQQWTRLLRSGHGNLTNLGPIVDMCVVDLERQGQGQVRGHPGKGVVGMATQTVSWVCLAWMGMCTADKFWEPHH